MANITCLHRKLAWLVPGKGLIFNPRKLRCGDGAQQITVPCGKCLACQVQKASEWSIRCQHEMLYADAGAFLTLTYDAEHLPNGKYELDKTDLQLFFKRLRRHLEYYNKPPFRSYLACGEYGSKRGRPHYHVFLIGLQLDDLKLSKISYSGLPIYTSPTIDKLWGKGFAWIGTCTRQSAGYVARYAKKVTQNKQKKPFFLASRNICLTNGQKGALGAQWVLDYHTDLLRGYLPLPEGKRAKVPEYYKDVLKKYYPDEYEIMLQNEIKLAKECDLGFLIFDSSNSPLTPLWRICYNMDINYEVIRSNLSEFLGVDVNDIIYDFDHKILNEKMKNLEEVQANKILKLKREME